MAEKHFTKARGYLVKGDEMYRKAAAEIRAGMKADPSLTQEEIGRWFGHSQSWVQRLLAWDKDYSSTNNPTPFVRPARCNGKPPRKRGLFFARKSVRIARVCDLKLPRMRFG